MISSCAFVFAVTVQQSFEGALCCGLEAANVLFDEFEDFVWCGVSSYVRLSHL